MLYVRTVGSPDLFAYSIGICRKNPLGESSWGFSVVDQILMSNGWIKLHRKLLDNPIVRSPAYFTVWIYLLLKASHNEHKFMWNGKVLMIKEGQILTGRKQISEETGVAETTLERILDYFEKEGQIGQQKESKYRVITIVHWKEYQNVDNRRTTDGHIQEGKEGKEERGEASVSYLKSIPEGNIKEITAKYNCTEVQVKQKGETLFDYCKAKGKVYKNYQAFLVNAIRKDYGYRPEKRPDPVIQVVNGVARIVGYK